MQMLSEQDAGNPTSSGPTVTTIYADTDTSLYTLDPATNNVTLVGAFAGFGSSSEGATDCAVNAAGDVYINSEVAVYKAVLPASPGTVQLTNRVAIAVQQNQSFYALAFTPAGVLGPNETLVGGDGNGELWAINPATGALSDLGNFGSNPAHPSDILGVSGDIVFYFNSMGAPTGLATIRSCSSGGSSCTKTDDYLAGIDMQALEMAYTSGTRAASLLAGVYGGGTNALGPGTQFGELFGLGAWQGTVYGFAHNPAQLVTISTTSGLGALVPNATEPMDGWAGAGVSTKTTITVIAPPDLK
jgi:hypothetical protein